MRRRTYLRRGGVLSVPLLAGCFGGTSGSGGPTETTPTVAETTSVTMVDSQFQPRNVHVDLGVPVTWENDDDHAHTVSAASDAWSMDAGVEADGSVQHAFEAERVYGVYCRYHGSADLTGMAMKVGVGDAAIENPVGREGGGSDPYDGN